MSRSRFGLAFWYVRSIEENPRMKISVEESFTSICNYLGASCILLYSLSGAYAFTFKILFLMLIDKFESFLWFKFSMLSYTVQNFTPQQHWCERRVTTTARDASVLREASGDRDGIFIFFFQIIVQLVQITLWCRKEPICSNFTNLKPPIVTK